MVGGMVAEVAAAADDERVAGGGVEFAQALEGDRGGDNG
jgi:hypothetical protein